MTTIFTTTKFRLPMTKRRGWRPYGIALAAVALAVSFGWVLGRLVGPLPAPYILFFPAVMFSAWYGGFGPGLVATFLSAPLSYYFFTPPFFTLSLPGRAEILHLFLFVGVGGVLCFLTENLRRALLLNNTHALDLLKYQQKISDILESIQGGFFTVDESGRFVHINKNCGQYLEDPDQNYLGKTLREVFPEWMAGEFGDLLKKAQLHQKPFRFEFLDPKNSRWHEVHFSPSSRGLSIHLHDITSRKRAQEELRLSREALGEANEALERRVRERTSELADANIALRNEIQERKKVEREAIEIVQKEQRRFSAQLHDGLCQKLSGIMMLMESISKRLEKGTPPKAKELNGISELINQSITDARDMARGLFPVELEANSLMFSLEGLAARSESLYGVSCRFLCPQPILITDNLAATHLFRIAQEAVQNAVTHGEARHIEISLTQGEKAICLRIKDDGKGFPAEVQTSPGIGLQIMRYRARMLDATLDFSGNSGETLLTCVFPTGTEEFSEKKS